MIMEDEDYPRLAALVSWQPDIAVYPLALDFGDAQVGDTVTALVTIVSEGAGPLGLGRILLSGDPAFSGTSPAPGRLEPGEGAGIVISFTPSAPGWTAAELMIESGDAEEPVVTVSLQGFGSLARLPPDEQCEAIIACANDWVEAGMLVGAGPGNPASHGKRLQALLKQLDAINDLLHKGRNERAFKQLSALYKEMDGAPNPQDFVSGDKAADLSRLLLDLMACIGVDEQNRARNL